MQHFLCAGYSKYFTYINLMVVIIIQGNRIVIILQISRVGTERLSNFSTVTQ